MIELLIGFLISFIAGLIGSMTGIGGGIVITPYLTYLNYAPSQISSTSLISVLSTGISSSYLYSKKKLVEYKVGITLAISSIPGTLIGAYVSSILSLDQFKYYFALVLIATALYLLIRTKIILRRKTRNYKSYNKKYLNFQNLTSALLFFLSFLAGILSSSFGIGGGIIFVPCLIILLGFKMNQAAATSQFALLFTSTSGLFVYILYGKPEYIMGLVLSIGSVMGSILGTRLATRINSDFLQKIFSAVLIIVSLKLLFDTQL